MKFILSFLFLFSTYSIYGNSDTILIKESDKIIKIENKIKILKDPNHQLKIQDLISNNNNFQKVSKNDLNLGYSKDTIWIHFSFKQEFIEETQRIFLVSNSSFNFLNFYLINNTSGEIIQSFETGNNRTFHSRPIKYREFAFPFSLKKNESYSIYLKIRSENSISFPLYIFDYPEFFRSINFEESLHGGFYGVILTFFIYSLLVFIISKDIVYIFYGIYILSYSISQAIGHGHFYQFLLPENVILNNSLLLFAIGINIITSASLTSSFLKLSVYSPLFKKFLNINILFTVFLLFIEIFFNVSFIKFTLLILSLFLSLVIVFVSIRVWIRGFKPARYFFLSWTVFYFGVNLTILKFFGIFPDNFLSEYGIQIGAFIQTLLLAVSLSDKANVVKRESQEATIRTLKYQETAKHDLEKKVQERTEELNKYVNTLKKDLQMANSIQLNIIPKEFLFLNSFNVYSKYIPLDKVGGDFYDIFEFNQNKIRLFIADATGHGVQAALVTMSIKSEYDSLKSIILQPSELLEELNLRFKDIYKNIKVYFSAVVLDLDLLNNKLTYSSAGHPDQFLIREKEIIPLRRTNRIMGLSIASDFVDKEIDFYKEDKIILFTDGIFEQFNDSREQYGDVRLKEKVLANLNSSVQTIVSEILQDLEEFVGEKEKQDDITIIGVECT